MNQILKVKEEKYVPRFPSVRNMVQKQVEKNVADYVVRAIEHKAYLDDVERFYTKEHKPELMPDTTPKVSFGLGEAAWNLINNFAL